MPPAQFTCENCRYEVPWLDAGLRHYEHRNQCPNCLWSKHILFGTAQLRPCDALMRPVMSTIQQTFFTTECDGCDYKWAAYNEDLWATLDPDMQTCWINMAWEQTQLLNDTPTIMYTVRPEYQTRPPRIPPELLGTRPRVNRRP